MRRDTTAAIAQLVARRSHNPKVVSSILTRRTLLIALAKKFCICVGSKTSSFSGPLPYLRTVTAHTAQVRHESHASDFYRHYI